MNIRETKIIQNPKSKQNSKTKFRTLAYSGLPPISRKDRKARKVRQ